MYGASSKCSDHLSNPVQPCKDKIEDECMGLQYANYVYRIKKGDLLKRFIETLIRCSDVKLRCNELNDNDWA